MHSKLGHDLEQATSIRLWSLTDWDFDKTALFPSVPSSLYLSRSNFYIYRVFVITWHRLIIVGIIPACFDCTCQYKSLFKTSVTAFLRFPRMQALRAWPETSAVATRIFTDGNVSFEPTFSWSITFAMPMSILLIMTMTASSNFHDSVTFLSSG